MIECVFLGTSGGITTERRQNSSLLLRSDKEELLVDCNGGCVAGLLKAGVRFEKLEHIFLTHRHVDHIGGLPSLVQQIWLKGCYYAKASSDKRTAALNIYGNQETVDKARNMLEVMGLFSNRDLFPIVFHALSVEGGALPFQSFGASYFPVSHGNVLCFGVAAREKDGSGIVYSSDTEPCQAVWDAIASGDVLVHECTALHEKLGGHTSWEDLDAVLAAGLPVSSLCLTHLPPINEAEEAAFAARLREKYGDKVVLAFDGMAIRV